MIEQILASHSQVDGTHELPDLPRVIRTINQWQVRGKGYPAALPLLDASQLLELGGQYLDATRRYRKGAEFFTDKMPNNFSMVGLLALILPNATIINALRHPLDSCMGSYKQLFYRGQAFTYDLVELGEYYLEYRRMMDHWHSVLPGKVLDVHYEQVVAGQESQSKRLLDHCGLPWEDGCLRFWETDRAVNTASSSRCASRLRRVDKFLAPLRRPAGSADRGTRAASRRIAARRPAQVPAIAPGNFSSCLIATVLARLRLPSMAPVDTR